jgi:hypothetical protein
MTRDISGRFRLPALSALPNRFSHSIRDVATIALLPNAAGKVDTSKEFFREPDPGDVKLDASDKAPEPSPDSKPVHPSDAAPQPASQQDDQTGRASGST